MKEKFYFWNEKS